MPCLIELGPAAKEAHKRIGQKIAQVCDQAIITTKEHFEDVKEGAGQSDKIVYVENAQEILEKIKDANAILLESRLPESLIKAVEKLLNPYQYRYHRIRSQMTYGLRLGCCFSRGGGEKGGRQNRLSVSLPTC